MFECAWLVTDDNIKRRELVAFRGLWRCALFYHYSSAEALAVRGLASCFSHRSPLLSMTQLVLASAINDPVSASLCYH